MQQKSNQGRCTRARAVIRQKGVFELVFAHHVLRELHVKFILRTEDLNVLRNVWCKILHRPRPVAKCCNVSEIQSYSQFNRESYCVYTYHSVLRCGLWVFNEFTELKENARTRHVEISVHNYFLARQER